MLYDLYRPLAAYDKLAKAINTGKYEAPYLKERAAKLGDLGGAEEGLRALSRISAMLKVQNSLFYLPLCGLMMWNYHALRLFNNWCLKYGRKAGEWFQAIGDFEELYSLAMLSYVKEEWSVPTITEDELPQLKFTNATHPLLEESKAVANSFAIDGGMAVITGSNMSRKNDFSTHYRRQFNAGLCRGIGLRGTIQCFQKAPDDLDAHYRRCEPRDLDFLWRVAADKRYGRVCKRKAAAFGAN